MPAADGALRLCIDFLWALRRTGLAIAPSQSVAAVRAATLVGFEDRSRLRGALASVLVTDAAMLPHFERTFDAFFAGIASARPDDRLRAAGILSDELEQVRAWLSAARDGGDGAAGAVIAALAGGAELEHLLMRSGASKRFAEASELRAGVTTQRVLDGSGLARARSSLTLLREALREQLGGERADRIVAALELELDLATRAVRERVSWYAEQARREREARDERWFTADLAKLDHDGRARARRALRELAHRLERAHARRIRASRRGRVAAGRTLRAGLRTWGVPLVLVRRRHPHRPRRLLVACDVSESVHAYSELLLEAVTQIGALVRGAKVSLFVSSTRDFSRALAGVRSDRALRTELGAVARELGHASSYGRALRELDRAWRREIDAQTMIVVLGDGRSNFRADDAEVLAKWKREACSVHLLVPEARSAWGVGDSAIARYLPHVSDAHELLSLDDFERAVRVIAARARR